MRDLRIGELADLPGGVGGAERSRANLSEHVEQLHAIHARAYHYFLGLRAGRGRPTPPDVIARRACGRIAYGVVMCRNIRPLFNFAPPATDAEIHDAALQYVRKVSGTRAPSGANEDVFERAVKAIAVATRRLVDSLETTAPPKNRETEAAKARARSAERFGTPAPHRGRRTPVATRARR